jgi:signal transduction histidine kinase
LIKNSLTKNTLSLPLRGALYFWFAGAGLSLLLTVICVELINDMERRMIDATLASQMQHQLSLVEPGVINLRPDSQLTQVYVVPHGAESKLPVYLAGLSTGKFKRRNKENEYHILVKDFNHHRLYVSVDSLDINPLHNRLPIYLVAGAIVFSVFLAWIGYQLTSMLNTPIIKLSDQLRKDPFQFDHTQSYNHCREVGLLAQQIDKHTHNLREAAQREKEFTSNVSHELRTLIAVMRGTLELLSSDKNFNRQSQHRLRRLKQAVGQMGELIKLFMKLANPNVSNDQEMKGNCEVESAIRELLETKKNEIDNKGLTATLAVQKPAHANAPRTVLHVVLSNVLNNAIKYTDHGHIAITLKQHSITFEDTGPGIEKHDEPLIFERRYRAGKTHIEGEGLGLAIVKKLCEHYGWTIDVNSVQGQGTQVQLFFAQI